ncbi:MAG: RT0821/Lpp0805 family surface protein [Pseudomonadota bacterium]
MSDNSGRAFIEPCCGTSDARLPYAGSVRNAASALAMAAFLSGCAVGGNSLATISSGEQLVTNAVNEETKTEGVDGTDAKVITDVVATVPTPRQNMALNWSNPETGSTGTVLSIDAFKGKHGQICRGFKTSVNSFMGVALYNGETCKVREDRWLLTWFKPAE